MGRHKKQETKEASPKRMKKRYSNSELEVALVEFVRAGYSSWKVEKVTGIHHTTIQRAWENLSLGDKQIIRERAGLITDTVSEAIISAEVDAIKALTIKLKDVSDLALDEIEARLKDPLRRMEIKDADLINIATKCLAMVKENTQSQEDKETAKSKSVTNIFNILDQSIQEHLTITSKEYEKH